VWGVGTRLVTGHDQPALGGVYKLSAIRADDGTWNDKLKLSEQAVKTSTPGILQVRRYRKRGRAIGDVIFDHRHPIQGDCVMVDLADDARRTTFPGGAESSDLLVPVFRQGKRVYELPSLEEIRARARAQLAEFPSRVTRLARPRPYPVGLELGLHRHKNELILEERGGKQ